jgi:hypothetical protein
MHYGKPIDLTGEPYDLTRPVSTCTVDCPRDVAVRMRTDYGMFLDGKGGRVSSERMFSKGCTYMVCAHCAQTMCVLGHARRV